MSDETAAISPAQGAQPQCQFFVLRKKRLCRMTVRPGRQYCGEHEPQPVTEDQEIDKRVPCPNDPKHTCYESKLEKHLVKCNARQMKDPPYIVRNINDPEEEDSSPRIPLKDVPTEILQKVIDKINLLYEKHVQSTISTYNPPLEHHPAVAACIAQGDRTHSSRRHLRQASRLLQLAEDQGLVAEDTCYVELGAGKGMLSYYAGVAWCARGSRVLCVDRAALRHKRDNRLGPRAARLRADLRHLALGRAPAAAGRIVGLAKHLCGVATDYALRCVTGAECAARVRGVLLATCCHHRCDRAYAGRRALQELGISGDDLNIIFGIVSWATCGDGRSRERRRAGDAADSDINNHKHTHLEDEEEPEEHDSKEPATNTENKTRLEVDNEKLDRNEVEAPRPPRLALTVSERQETGRRAKALLDHGRVLFLRRAGFVAGLTYYVPAAESLENVCIVARKHV